MDKKEFYKMSVGLKAAYPRFTFLSTDEEMEFWYTMLRDIDYEVAQNAVLEHISTSTFPPCIAEIRKLCVERCTVPVLPFAEAWQVVQNAISSFGRDNPQGAFETMDELTREIVKNLGWNNICTCEKTEVSRANFRMAYEAKAKTLLEQRQLPEFVQQHKVALQKQYIPTLEQKPVMKIDTKQGAEENTELNHVQDRGKQLEELRRRLYNGAI